MQIVRFFFQRTPLKYPDGKNSQSFKVSRFLESALCANWARKINFFAIRQDLCPFCTVTSKTKQRGKESNFELHLVRNILTACVSSGVFLVTGCADLDPVEGAEVVRDNDVTTITCQNNQGQSWRMMCNQTSGEWKGEYSTCSVGECEACRAGMNSPSQNIHYIHQPHRIHDS